MKLTVLGCLGAYPYEGQGTTSYLLQADGFNLLLDAGSSTLVELERSWILGFGCSDLNSLSS